MPTLDQIALAGGLYVPVAFWHFVADWLTQPEKMAENKSSNFWLLLLHCCIYTVLFVPVLIIYGIPMWMAGIAATILFMSHFVGDTYAPVWFWAKFIRRMTFRRDVVMQRQRVLYGTQVFNVEQVHDGPFYFKPTLMVVIDQLWHLFFLWVIPIFAILEMQRAG